MEIGELFKIECLVNEVLDYKVSYRNPATFVISVKLVAKSVSVLCIL